MPGAQYKKGKANAFPFFSGQRQSKQIVSLQRVTSKFRNRFFPLHKVGRPNLLGYPQKQFPVQLLSQDPQPQDHKYSHKQYIRILPLKQPPFFIFRDTCYSSIFYLLLPIFSLKFSIILRMCHPK